MSDPINITQIFFNPSIYLIKFSDDFLMISMNDFDGFDDFFIMYNDFMLIDLAAMYIY